MIFAALSRKWIKRLPVKTAGVYKPGKNFPNVTQKAKVVPPGQQKTAVHAAAAAVLIVIKRNVFYINVQFFKQI